MTVTKNKTELLFPLLRMAYPELEVPLLQLARDALHIGHVSRAFHHGFQVFRSPSNLAREGRRDWRYFIASIRLLYLFDSCFTHTEPLSQKRRRRHLVTAQKKRPAATHCR